MVELFRNLQPVAPLFYSYPGTPPRLIHRTIFHDGEVLDELRGERTIIKGRFQKGRVSYVLAEDLQLYATAFRKPLADLNDTQQRVLDVVQEIGPANTDQIKEVVDQDGGEPLLKKQIMPALHRMQEAFIVFEDQIETNWDRGWCEFAAEWPGVDLDAMLWEEAAEEVIRRFFHAMVFATFDQVRDWACWSVSKIKKLLARLEDEGRILPIEVKGMGEGWVLEHPDYDPEITPATWMIHRADYLAYAYTSELKARYKDFEVLQYLLVDGEFKGAVLGHWRIGPHDVEDVVVELPKKERGLRRAEILKAVLMVYSGKNHEVVCYDGEDLPWLAKPAVPFLEGRVLRDFGITGIRGSRGRRGGRGRWR
jgi:hypothetical protein